MNRKLTTLRFVLAIGVLLASIPTSAASAADTLTVTRSDGTMDAFAVLPGQGVVLQLRHTAIAANGIGTVFSNDIVNGAVGTTCSLISAGWVNSNQSGAHTELHLRAYLEGGGLTGSVVEFVWNSSNVPKWTGPNILK
jgi:hypothetical protein